MKATAMQGSSSHHSYARNSIVQNRNFHAVAKPFLAKAVELVVHNIVCAGREVDKVWEARGLDVTGTCIDHSTSGSSAAAAAAAAAPALCMRQHIAVADLGCSYGSNTLDCAQVVLQTLQQSWPPAEATAHVDDDGLEVQYYFCDLPSNDFNALFQSLSSITGQQESVPLPKVRVAGVPGSFYGCLFPSASLDLAICSYSLHWLSQVPSSIVDKSSRAWNGGHTWINQGPKDVLDAYAMQSQIDVTNFLKSRAHELSCGGILFLFLAASSSTQQRECSHPYQDCTWTLFDCAWKEMIDEGIITSEQMDMFNMPLYFMNEHELEHAIQKVPELKLLQMKLLEDMANQETFTLHQWYGFITSVTKPLVETHLGKYKANELFKRLKNIAFQQKDFNSHFTHSLIVASLERL